MMQALGAFMSGIDIPLMDAGNVGFGILSMLWDRGRCYYRRTQYFLVDYLAALLRGVTPFSVPDLVFGHVEQQSHATSAERQ